MTQTLLKAYLSKTQQDLNILKEQQAKYGHNPPIELRNQIQDYETAIALTRRALADELTETKWRQALKRLRVPQPPISSRARWRQLPVIFKTLVIGLFFIGLMVVSGLFLVLSNDIQAMRQPSGPLSAFWPAPTPTPLPMPETGFNIAVAQFTTLDEATNSLTSTPESQALSEWLFGAIQAEMSRLPSALRAEIRGPNLVEPILDNPGEVAERHNATLLIYGTITRSYDTYYVQPEFYVSQAGFSYGSEVIGADRLGKPVSFDLPLDDPVTLIGINEKLNARVQALQSIVAGLANYYVNRYAEAATEFQRAVNVARWEESEGKEVVYLLLGAAELLAYRDEENDLSERVQALSQAKEAFELATELNSDYARSYLGLGTVALQEATLLNPGWPDQVDLANLVEAETWYTRSLKSTDQPVLAYVQAKAAFGLGQVHLAGYQQDARWSRAKAKQFFEQVIMEYVDNQVPALIWFAGNAHGNLCVLADLDQNWQMVLAECQAGIDMLETLPGKQPDQQLAYYYAEIGFAAAKLDQPELAKKGYRQAILLGEKENLSPADVEIWQDALDRLMKGTP